MTVAGEVSLVRGKAEGGCCLEMLELAFCLLSSWRFLFSKHFLQDFLAKDSIDSPSFCRHLPNFILWTRASGFEGSVEGVEGLLWVFIDG